MFNTSVSHKELMDIIQRNYYNPPLCTCFMAPLAWFKIIGKMGHGILFRCWKVLTRVALFLSFLQHLIGSCDHWALCYTNEPVINY